jgi:excinuclease UvrABC ATPase subunit
LGNSFVVTGLSGAGKSSLFSTRCTPRGQRRYVETFSAYTRQFLDLLDKHASMRSRTFALDRHRADQHGEDLAVAPSAR